MPTLNISYNQNLSHLAKIAGSSRDNQHCFYFNLSSISKRRWNKIQKVLDANNIRYQILQRNPKPSKTPHLDFFIRVLNCVCFAKMNCRTKNFLMKREVKINA